MSKKYLYSEEVIIDNPAGNAELVIKNATKDVDGFLYNLGNGQTEFRPVTGTSPYFTKTLTAGDSHAVLLSEHGISPVRNVTVLAPTGEVINTFIAMDGDDITIASNLDLLNHIIKIY